MSNVLYRNIRQAFQDICDEGVLKLSNSEYEPLDACPTKGAFTVLARRLPTKGQLPLIFGGAFHASTEALLRGKTIPEQIEAAMKHAQAEKMGLYEDNKRNYGTLESLARMFAAEYEMRAKKFKPLDLDGELAIEKTFEMPIGIIYVYDTFGNKVEVEVFLRGKLDILSYWNGKQIWVVDHKTTTVMGEQFTADKMRGSQFLIYVMGAREIMSAYDTELDVRGCVVNVAAIRVRGFDFQTFDLPFPHWQVEQFKSNLLHRIQTWCNDMSGYLRLEDSEPDFLTCRQSCVTKYGKCAYFDVCNMMPKFHGDILYDDNMYRDETHSKETYGE